MKPFHILGLLVLSLLGGYIGAKFATPAGSVVATTMPITAPAATTEIAGAPDKALAARVDALDMQLAMLQQKVEDGTGSASTRLEAPRPWRPRWKRPWPAPRPRATRSCASSRKTA